MKQRSLDLAATRAAAAGLTNVQTWCGDITEYDAPFGLGLALHACGEASDLAMRACVDAGALPIRLTLSLTLALTPTLTLASRCVRASRRVRCCRSAVLGMDALTIAILTEAVLTLA